MKFAGKTWVYTDGDYRPLSPRSFTQLADLKADTTNGGTFTKDAWQTRVLNTIEVDDIGVTLSSNQFILPAGSYEIFAYLPAHLVDRHQGRLQNISDTATTLVGSSKHTDGGHTVYSTVSGRFTITGAKTFELQHYCQTTQATNGFGVPGSFAEGERYTTVRLWKVDG